MKAQIERDNSEKESLQKQLRDNRDDARRKINVIESRNQELEADNTAMHAQLKNNENKMKKQNELNDKVRHLEAEKVTLESRLQTQQVKSQKSQDLKIDAERRSEQLRREIDLLT